MPMPSANLDRIEWASRKVELHDFVMSLPEGYNTQLENNANNLPSGCKKQVALARALITNPTVLILDEAFAGLSLDKTLQMCETLKQICQGRTVCMISHDLRTIRTCDTILVLNDGNVVDQGTHKELLSKEGYYKTLWKKQYEDLNCF